MPLQDSELARAADVSVVPHAVVDLTRDDASAQVIDLTFEDDVQPSSAPVAPAQRHPVQLATDILAGLAQQVWMWSCPDSCVGKGLIEMRLGARCQPFDLACFPAQQKRTGLVTSGAFRLNVVLCVQARVDPPAALPVAPVLDNAARRAHLLDDFDDDEVHVADCIEHDTAHVEDDAANDFADDDASSDVATEDSVGSSAPPMKVRDRWPNLCDQVVCRRVMCGCG